MITDHVVFQAECGVGPTVVVGDGPAFGFHVDVAVLGGDQGQAFGQGGPQLDGEELDAAALKRGLVVGDVVVHEMDPSLRQGARILKEQRI
jgi:hypothetical protein